MTKAQRIMSYIYQLCRFCPICGFSLEQQCYREAKKCPQGCGEFCEGGFSDNGTDPIFEVSKERYRVVE